MQADKKLLLFCERETTDLIYEIDTALNIEIREAEDELDFALQLSTVPKLVIFEPSLADSSLLASLDFYQQNQNDVRIAAIISDDEPEAVKQLLKFNITTFFSKDNIKDNFDKFCKSAKSQNSRTDVMKRSIERLRKFIGELHEGVILLDDSGKVAYVNDSASDILGMSKSELNRKRLNEIFLKHPFAKENSSDKPISKVYEEADFTTANNNKVHLNATINVNFSAGAYDGAVITLSQLTTKTNNRKNELELLKYKEKYHSLQQNQAFQKQMIVLKDETSNTTIGDYFTETYFKPLDVLSGDFYGSINIRDGRYLFYIIDAMGKGLSASVTAIQSSSFINHSVELSILKDDFNMDKMLNSFFYYIRDRLMDYESLCIVFAVIDTNDNTLNIANFGMPPLLLQNDKGELIKIRNNNLPIMRCVAERRFQTHSLEGIDKIMMMSDGVVESQTKDNDLYFSHIDKHFQNAVTKKHFVSMMNKCIDSGDDDMTFFLFRRSCKGKCSPESISVKSSMSEISRASEWLKSKLADQNMSIGDISHLEFAFTEILMNALEHGNLGIGHEEKHKMITDGSYEEVIAERTKDGSITYEKEITVGLRVDDTPCGDKRAIMITIQDEGSGFAPAHIFKYHSFDGHITHISNEQYNGRGVFIADNLVDGIYYNENGNTAHLIKLISKR